MLITIRETEIRNLLRSLAFLKFGELPYKRRFECALDEVISLLSDHGVEDLLYEFHMIDE